MTIAISLKINDGIVLATDSATSVMAQTAPNQLGVVNVYSNANKLFNLRKGLPIGIITWGVGSIGLSSISTLMKDLRDRFSGATSLVDWTLEKDNYTIEQVANRVKEFIFDELYVKEFQKFPQKPPLGFVIAGYSPGAAMPEEFQIDMDVNGHCIGPRRLRAANDCGVSWSGEPEAINRLLAGYSPQLWPILKNSLNLADANLVGLKSQIDPQLQVPLVFPAMPLQDAIDLAEFLVQLTISFSRFKPGAPTVGGPIELAAISKHEGFRWIKRKYYFDRDINPDISFTRTFDPTPSG